MIFNSLVFVVFFIAVFGIYWGFLSNRLQLRNAYLLLVSYVFYGYWDYRFLGLIVFSSAVDYLVGRSMAACRKTGVRRLLLSISLISNLGMLGFFKYYNFFVDSASEALQRLGVGWNPDSLSIVLPVGISFYTFQTLSYTIDVYRRKITPSYSIVDFFAYVSFFPQLVAGPIERAGHLLPQFKRRFKFDGKEAVDGAQQILWGFFKKVAVADNAAIFVNAIFSDYSNQSGGVLALGAFLFAIQIYCDFSGYSDIAIGTARLLGFDLMKNFSCPYFSRDIGEFWRRWHISLSTWFRDYLYIPLGGSRCVIQKQIRNILIVFVISGVWHGANWTFVFWGLLNGLLFLPLLLRKANRTHLDTVASGRGLPSLKECGQMILTFSLTCLCWVFFRSDSITDAFNYLWACVRNLTLNPLTSFANLPLSPSQRIYDFSSTLALIGLLIVVDWIQREKPHGLNRLPLHPFAVFGFCVMLLIVVLEYFYARVEFIYFQF